MKLFLPPLLIGDEEGFTPEKDIFDRKVVGDGLTNLVTSVDQPLVIALDAQWGSGKSTFLKMWSGELRKKDIGVVLFDAFENDYLEDAFTAIAGQIVALAKDKNKAGEGHVQRFVQKAYGAGKIIARSGLKIGLKAATVGALEAEDFKGIAEEIGSEASSLGDKYLGEALTKQKEQKAIIEQFREALADLPGLLSPTPSRPAGTQQKPLVIIIDELDRCRPSFALEMLERIKHFFSVPNIHFVLGVHLGQLENSVRAAYGADINGKVYLQKFISLTILLADNKRADGRYTPVTYCNWMSYQLGFDEGYRSIYAYIIGHVAISNHLSLRTIEKIFTTVAMAIAFIDPRSFCPPQLIAGLCVLRVIDPTLYVLAKTGDLRYADVENILALDRLPKTKSKIDIVFARQIWQYCTDYNLDDDVMDKFKQELLEFGFSDRGSILPDLTGRLMDKFLPINHNDITSNSE